jgi:general secretion pathway protein D
MAATQLSPRFQRTVVRLLAFAMAAATTLLLPAQQAQDDTPSIKVNFPNTPIGGIIPVYQQLTGKKMILDGSLQGETLKIIGTRPLTKKEAVNFIEASLLLNGYAVIRVDDSTVKLIHHSGGKSPTSERLPVYSSIRDLPENEEIVHFVLPLANISPDEAVKAFTTVIKLHSYGAITPVTNTSNIIITENSATIRSVYELAQIIDVPPAEIANEMIELKRSDAESVAEIINEIYEEKEKSENAPASGRSDSQGNPAQAANAAPKPVAPSSANTANTNPTAAKVKVIPHRRTNSLLVIARPVDITYIKGLVEKLDRESSGSNFLERKLRYMPVVEFLQVARDALSRDTDIDSEGNSTSGGSDTSSTRRRSSTNSPSTDARQASRSSNDFGTGGSIGGDNGFNSNASRSLLDDPDETGAPESVVVGKTLLIADSRSNTLIVNGSPEHVDIIDKLIERMDLRPQEVYLSTVIGQLNLGDEYDYGVDMLKALDDFTLRRADTATTTTSTGNTTTGTTTTTGTGTSTGSTTGTGTGGVTGALANAASQVLGTPGLVEFPVTFDGYDWSKFNLYGQIGSIGRYLHLLEGNKNFKVLNRPSMTVRNNEKAVISNGQRIAVPVSTLSNVGGGVGNTAAVSSSIDYRDVVLKLEVVPLINSNDEVTLRIAQVNDNVVGQQTIGGNSIPTIGTQELVTTVSVKDGATVVLGGLITEREQRTENGVIFLRRIPVLKHLFNRKQITKAREELLIFIQPKIIKGDDPLDLPNDIEAGRSKVFGEAMRFANEIPEAKRALPAE